MIRRRFGVHIPPWNGKETAKPITIEFVLTGKIPSKKNRQRASFNYSWAIAQVKYYFKTRTKKDFTIAEGITFFIKLIRNIRPFIFKPEELKKWEEESKVILLQQAAYWSQESCFSKYGLSFPLTRCSVSIRHYWADHRERDNTNREQSIHDILVESQIIADDNYKCIFKNTSEAKDYTGEILDHITTITIVAYKW